jgi:hypothetical protein
MEKLFLLLALLIDIRSWILYLLAFLHTWIAAISNPKQFLAPLFQPSDTQIVDGLEFYFLIIVFNLLLYAPFILGRTSELADKIRLLASSVVGQLFGVVLVLSWHLAFWLLGGGASFSGSYLVTVYAGGPYMMLASVTSLIAVAALPPELRPLALNPVTAQQAIQLGIADPRTNSVAIVLGGFLSWGITIVMTVVLFRCMSFTHSLVGWRLAVAILFSLLISCLLVPALKFVSSIFMPPPVVPPSSATPDA